jgi:hypothetical protein
MIEIWYADDPWNYDTELKVGDQIIFDPSSNLTRCPPGVQPFGVLKAIGNRVRMGIPITPLYQIQLLNGTFIEQIAHAICGPLRKII